MCAGDLPKRCPIAAMQTRIRHAMFEMVMARVAAIDCGYEDANDLDRLRHDPLMKLAVGRCPQSGAALASQSTISRLENAPRKTEAARLCAALIDQFGTTVRPGQHRQSSTSTTHSARHMGLSNLHSGTPITTSAPLRRCTSITSRAARRWWRSCAQRAPRRVPR